jgi:hypothetical protein
VVGTYGDRVVKWAKRELGLTPDGWQAYALRKALQYDRHGDLIARTALLSTGRQNGKSVIVRSLIGWMMDEGQHLPPFEGWSAILAAAHDSRQARLVYRGVMGDIEKNDRLSAQTRTSIYRGISAGHVDFDVVTNQPGSARGWSAGMLAWDEMLTQRDWEMWGALVPTQSAQRSPIMVLTSTAGHPDSVVLRALYDRLIRQSTGDEKPDPTFYAAWWQSEDPDAGLDWTQVQQANPSLGTRLRKRAIASEYATSPRDLWRRERLNHWVETRVEGAFNPGVWAACRTAKPLEGLTGPFALGVDVQPGWERATIVVAGIRPDGRVGIEVYRDLRASDSTPVTAARLTHEIESFPDPVQVIAYDQVSGAAPAFRRHADETGLPYDELKPSALVAACMDTVEMILSGRIAVDDPLLDAQIGWAARRNVGQDGAFRFGRAASGGPIDAVMAMTFGAHGIVYQDRMPQIF